MNTRARLVGVVLLTLGPLFAGSGTTAIAARGRTDAPAGTAAGPQNAPPRIIVKLRPGAVDGASGEMGTFLRRHHGQRLAPVFAGRLDRQREAGLSDRDLARRTRARFATRATRSEKPFAPPVLSTSYVLELDMTAGREGVAAALAGLRADPAVEYAEEDRRVQVSLVPNDPYFATAGSWGQAYDDLWGLKKMQAAAAWDQTTGDGIIVAVVDTGIDYTHPDIANNVWVNPAEIPGNLIDDDGNGFVDDVRGWDFIGHSYTTVTPDANPTDGHGHGTHVAGTIAAEGNNGIGVIGVAWRARVMAVKGLDDLGYGLNSTLADAIVYAADNGADVINNSWGGTGSSQLIADAIAYAHSLGVVVVAAAGNERDDARNHYPAGLADVIAVAATTATDSQAFFSNWGSRIDVAAPGVDILSLRASGTTMGIPVGTGYTRADGTSMASPHVAGLAALVLATHPTYSNEQVRQAIRASARDVGSTGPDLDFGYGRIDAAAAVALSGVLEAKILTPADGARVGGPTTLMGVARGSGFARYRLEFSPGRSSTTWTLLQEGTGPVDGGALGDFDPSALADSVYTVRLTAFDETGRAFSDRIELVVDYVAITSPAVPLVPVTAAVFKTGVSVPISGKAEGPSFQSFRLEWSRGIVPSTAWSAAGVSLVGGGAAPVTEGALGTWDTGVVSQADYYTVRLTVENLGFVSEARTIVYLEPDLLAAGWPRWLDLGTSDSCGLVPVADAAGNLRLVTQGYNTFGGGAASFWSFSPDGSSATRTPLNFAGFLQPAAGDFDGQPGDEAIAMESAGLRVFRQDGTFYTLPVAQSANFQNAQPVLEDLDGDGQLEVVGTGTLTGTNTTLLYAWKRDGSQLAPAFPIALANLNFSIQSPEGHRALVADLDGDGNKEILATEGPSDTTFTLKVFRADGTPRSGWPNPTFTGYLDKIVLADLDRDGSLEIVMMMIAGSQKQVHVLETDGSERPGWPAILGRSNASYIAIGDIDRDGRDEIVISNFTSLYVLKADGTPFSADWPWNLGGFVTTGGVVLADVDADGYPEILVARDVFGSSSNPLLPAARGSAGAPGPAETAGSATLDSVRAVRQQPDGSLAVSTTANPGLTAFNSLFYQETSLLALRPDRTVARSWRLLGANGNQPIAFDTKLLAGDFDRNGTLDIAATYRTILGGGTSGTLQEGVVTVLTTGAPYNASDNDWPMLFQNPRNTATRSRRDTAAPSVILTAPVEGAVVTGPITVSAHVADDVWVAGVQFQLDGADLGAEDTTLPFAVSWDGRLAAEGSHVLTAAARDGAGHRTTSAPVTVTVVRDTTPPAVSITAPVAGSELSGTVMVSVEVSDDFGVSSVELYVDGVLRGTSASAPFTIAWDTMAESDGAHSLVARAYDGALNGGDSTAVPVTVRGRASYDASLRVPVCADVRAGCDSGLLLNGRGPVGPEPNAPNTIHGSCPDSTITGAYHQWESNDRLKVRTVDGRKLAAGRTLRIEATVWTRTAGDDRVDLYYAPDANNPAWIFLATLTPNAVGQQVLSATHPLGEGPLQAVRARVRFAGSASPCGGGILDDNDDLAFAVGQNAAPAADAGGPYATLRNQAVTFDGSASADADGDPLTYQWDFGDGTSGTGVRPTHIYAAPGTFMATLVVSDGAASSAPATATVTVTNRAPAASAGGPYGALRNQPISFDGTASSDPDGDALAYQWDFGDGATGTGARPVHAYATPGTFAVRLTVSDGFAASDPATATVTIANRPPVANGGGPYTGVRQQPVAFNGSGSSDPDGDPLTYAWTFGDGATGSGPTPSHAYGSLGTFAVTLVVSDGLASSPTSTTSVTISNRPPTVTLTAPVAGAVFNAPATITLTASAADADGSVSQVEFFAGATRLGVDTSAPYSFNWTSVVEGAYVLTARATDNQGAATTSSPVAISVEAHLRPTADAFVRDGSGNTNKNFGTQTTLQLRTGSSGNNRWTYLKFDTAAAASVGSARLRLFGNLSATTGMTVTTSAFGATNTTWSETQITWNNKPASGTTAQATVPLDNGSVSPRWYEWDLTSYLRQEKAAGRNVVTIVLKNDVATSPFAQFNAREAGASLPELVIRP